MIKEEEKKDVPEKTDRARSERSGDWAITKAGKGKLIIEDFDSILETKRSVSDGGQRLSDEKTGSVTDFRRSKIGQPGRDKQSHSTSLSRKVYLNPAYSNKSIKMVDEPLSKAERLQKKLKTLTLND